MLRLRAELFLTYSSTLHYPGTAHRWCAVCNPYDVTNGVCCLQAVALTLRADRAATCTTGRV